MNTLPIASLEPLPDFCAVARASRAQLGAACGPICQGGASESCSQRPGRPGRPRRQTLEVRTWTVPRRPRPSADELVERARGLVPLLYEKAEETERARCVAPETIAAMRDRQLFRVLLPARFGGFEDDLNTLVRMVCELSAACGSTGWVAGLMMIHQWLCAQFPIEIQEELWGDDPDAIVAGSYASGAVARKEPGGYRITGRWPFASGCDHAGWALIGVTFPPDGDDDRPQPGFVLAGEGEFSIADDWFVVGLAGTGSKSVVCDDQLIPAHRRVILADLNAGLTPGARALGSPLYRIPLLAAIPAAIVSPALGILDGAIRDFVAATEARKTRGAVVAGGARMAEYATVQARLGEAAGTLAAGGTLLRSDLDETQRRARAGETIDVDYRIKVRLAQAFVVRLAVQGIDALYGATGGGGLYLGHRVQRAWRDIHAVSHHVSLNWDAVSTMYGQHALGLEPRGQY